MFIFAYSCVEKFSHFKQSTNQKNSSSKQEKTKQHSKPFQPIQSKNITTYYDILNIEKTASQEEIRKAYKTMVKRYHPDHNPGTDASTKFIKIKEAYDTLINPKKRIQYDEKLSKGNEQW